MPALSLNEFQRRMEGLEKLPSLPAILLPLLNQLSSSSEDVDLHKTIQLVSHDSALSSQVLRTANSSQPGTRPQITSLRAAAIALGVSRLRDLVTSCCQIEISVQGRDFDPTCFWEHSLACALVSRYLARKIRYADVERAYLAGLVHDMGILVNLMLIPHEFSQVFKIAMETRRSLADVEREQIGVTHDVAGELLCSHWHLDDLSELMRCHHDVGNATKEPVLVALVNIADLLCRTSELGYGYEEKMNVSLPDEPAWKVLTGHSSAIHSLDMTCFTMEIESYVQEVRTLISVLFRL